LESFIYFETVQKGKIIIYFETEGVETHTACPISDNKHARPPITFSSPLLRAGRRSTSLRKCTLHNKTWGSPYKRKHNSE
jgi:hypothetical protein